MWLSGSTLGAVLQDVPEPSQAHLLYRVPACETSVLLCQCVQLLLHPVNQLYMHTLFCCHL